MGRTRLVLLAAAAVLAISALASIASASGSEQWYVAGAGLAGGSTQEVVEKATVGKNAELSVSGVSVLVTCSGLKAKKTFIKGLAEMTAESLVFTGCAANNNCTVTTEISTTPLVAAVKDVVGSTKEVEIKFEPVTPTKFANITFSGTKCPLTGTEAIRGTMKTMMPNGQTEATTQELVTNSSGELKVGTNPATLKSTLKDELVSKKMWSFH